MEYRQDLVVGDGNAPAGAFASHRTYSRGKRVLDGTSACFLVAAGRGEDCAPVHARAWGVRESRRANGAPDSLSGSGRGDAKPLGDRGFEDHSDRDRLSMENREAAHHLDSMAERVSEVEDLSPAELTLVVVYLNRLSDLLFVLARVANRRAGAGEVTW